MAFQVAPQAIGHRTLPALLVVLGIVGVVAFAVVTSDGSTEPGEHGSASPPAEAAVTSPSGPAPRGARTPSPTAMRPAPSGPTRGLEPAPTPSATTIDCHDLGRPRCDDVVWAALHLLGAQPRPSAIGGWQSLLCDSSIDCPTRLLDGRRPVGSAVVALASGDTVWINVMGSAADAGTPRERSGLTAWVVRWLPKPSTTP